MPGFVYLLSHDGLHKIGASKTPRARARAVAPGGTLVHTFPSEDHYRVERALHRRFAEQHVGPGREWFHLDEKDVALVCQVAECNSVDDLPAALQSKPKTSANITLDGRLHWLAKIVATHRGIRLGEYLEAILRPAIERDAAVTLKELRKSVQQAD